VTGANIENASFGLTCCAERTAVFTAAAAGHRVITAIAVTTSRVETVTPCGACRQVLNEFKPADTDMLVLLDGPKQETVPLAALLPKAFGPRDLAE
jgi:cytidine deaminase